MLPKHNVDWLSLNVTGAEMMKTYMNEDAISYVMFFTK